MQIRKRISGVNFQPWEGENYERKTNEFSGIKLLVLGESHYDDASTEADQASDWIEFEKRYGEEHFTSFVVKKWGQQNSSRYFTTVANILLGLEGERNERKAEIWDHVAFYNYVSTFVPWYNDENRAERPTTKQWEKSKKPFESVLRELKPDTVLMTGKELTDKVVSNHNHEEFDLLYVPYIHGDINFLGIIHPSGGLTYNKANPAFQNLLEETRNRINSADLIQQSVNVLNKLP